MIVAIHMWWSSDGNPRKQILDLQQKGDLESLECTVVTKKLRRIFETVIEN